MATYILWGAELILCASLVVVLAGKNLFRKFPFFFLYLTLVLAIGLIRMYVYAFKLDQYFALYWYTQFLSVAVGHAVLWEIYQQSLRDYPGTLKIARVLVSTLFAGALILALVNAFTGEASALIRSSVAFERNLRALQGALLTLLLALIGHYAIPLGRNLWGLILGYGFYIGVSVVTLTLRSYLGVSFDVWWHYLQLSSYLIALSIWLPALWVYAPNPKPDVAIRLEEDYEILAERTYRAIGKARNSLLRLLES